MAAWDDDPYAAPGPRGIDSSDADPFADDPILRSLRESRARREAELNPPLIDPSAAAGEAPDGQAKPGFWESVKDLGPVDVGLSAVAGAVDLGRSVFRGPQPGMQSPLEMANPLIGGPVRMLADAFPEQFNETVSGDRFRDLQDPEYRQQLEKDFVRRDDTKEWYDPSAYSAGDATAATVVGTAAESLASVGAGIGAGGIAAAGARKLAEPLIKRSVAGSILEGEVAAAATKLAAIDKAILVGGYGLGEGTVAYELQRQGVRDSVLDLPFETLRQSPRFREIYAAAQELPEAERLEYARETLASELGNSAALQTLAVTMATGTIGSSAVGKIAGRMGARSAAEELGGEAAASGFRGAVKGAAEETGQELIQSGAEGYIGASALQSAGADVDPIEQAVNQGVGGAAAGGLIGGGLGYMDSGTPAAARPAPSPAATPPPPGATQSPSAGADAAPTPPGGSPGDAGAASVPTETPPAAAPGRATAADVSKLIKAAKKAGVPPDELRAISQAVINGEATNEEAAAALQQAIAAAPTAQPEPAEPTEPAAGAPVSGKPEATTSPGAAPTSQESSTLTAPGAPEASPAAAPTTAFGGDAEADAARAAIRAKLGGAPPAPAAQPDDTAELEALGRRTREAMEAALGKQGQAPAAAAPQSAEFPELADAIKQLDDPTDGPGITSQQLLGEVEALLEAGRAPQSLAGPAAAYREALRADFEEDGGRGETEPQEEAFTNAVRAALAPPATPAAPASTTAKAAKPKKAKAPKPKKRKQSDPPDPKQDSLLQFMARHGLGISLEEAKAQGLDPADMADKMARVGIRRAFRNGGMPFDQAAELAKQAGFPAQDEDGNYTPNALLDAIRRELGGKRVWSLSNTEWMDREAEEKAEAEQQRAEWEGAEVPPPPRAAGVERDAEEVTAIMGRLSAKHPSQADAIGDWVGAEWGDDSPATLNRLYSLLEDALENGIERLTGVPDAEPAADGEPDAAEGLGAGRLPADNRVPPEAGAGDAAPSPPPLELTPPDPATLAAEKARVDAAEAAKKQAEAKAQSEIDAKNFALAGSDRPSDANPNQTDPFRNDDGSQPRPSAGGMFTASGEARPAAPAAEPTEGASLADTKEIGQAFDEAQEEAKGDGDFVPHRLFVPPKPGEIARAETAAGVTSKNEGGKKVWNREAGWMTLEQARERIQGWKDHAAAQGDAGENSNKVVLSLFDRTGSWSQPWEDAGYQVYRFDIQEDPENGDVEKFSVEFFNDVFGAFEGQDVYAVLAACPCTDFAVSGARHFAAKDADGRTVKSVELVHQTLRTVEYFKPSVWAIENPVGRIEQLSGLPPWRYAFDPFAFGDPYTKRTLLWGRFGTELPTAPVDPVEGSKMHAKHGGSSQATKNARSVTPEGFSYAFFMANNAIDNPVMAIANKFDRLDRGLMQQAVDAGMSYEQITEVVEEDYYQTLDDAAAETALRAAIAERRDRPPVAAPPPRTEREEEIPDEAFAESGGWKIGDAVRGKGGVAGEIKYFISVRGKGGARDRALILWDEPFRDESGRISTSKSEQYVDVDKLKRPKGPGGEKASKPKVEAKPNTVFTEDAAEKARALLRSKLGQANAGVDPELMQAGITLSGYHIEKGARTFAAYARAMIADLGDIVKPYLKQWYMGVKYDPRAGAIEGLSSATEIDTADVDAILAAEEGDPDVLGPEPAAEPDRDDPADADDLGEGAVPANGEGEAQGAGRAGGRARGRRRAAAGGPELSDRRPAAGGKSGNQPFHHDDGRFGAAGGAAGSDDGGRGAEAGGSGAPDERAGKDEARAAADRTAPKLTLAEKRQRQAAAESIPVKTADRENIAATLPFLLDFQHDDVLKAEQRFEKPNGYGMLFANGTGTGKTYVGLGVIKRLVRQGKGNGLIVVPSQKIADDWVRSAKDLGLNIHKLDSIDDKGRGVSITTYANLGENRALADREYDFVMADEAHSLMQSADAKVTSALESVRALTLHPQGLYARTQMKFRKEYDVLRAARDEIDVLQKRRDPVPAALQQRWQTANNIYQQRLEEVRADIAARQLEARPRAMFLSATPFAYEPNVQWAEGFLFDFPVVEGRGYNSPDGYGAFMIQHFGYRMRTGKLTQPDANVDSNLMQRQFNTWLRKEGVLSTRMIDSDFDYDRKFVLLESAVGSKIDEGLEYLRSFENGKYSKVYDLVSKKFDYLARSRLLEALKAREIVPYIRAQHALGRKVVVFYDYNEGGGFNVFDVQPPSGEDPESQEVAQLVRAFRAARPDLVELDTFAPSPLQTLLREFPNAATYNGLTSTKKRTEGVDAFNNDAMPKANLVLAQKAANAGWSAHDTTGKHPRVLINLGLPTAPTVAIQQEGRIYRVGQASDAMFRYVNTGTTWERTAFASTIARRAATAENLAMGEQARGLKDAFIEAFESATSDVPGEGDGKGGKERDRALVQALSEFDRAKTFYFSQQKKNSRTKAQEGTDYFATPEPLGLKMVEWAGVRPTDALLEPSAGHGAIARFFPDLNRRTVIEPSQELASRLGLVTDAKLLNERFEDHHVVNKYDAIVMNPPFGVGGKTAIEHLAKAFTHLRDGGRIVALIPTGPAADKRFDAWLYGKDGDPEDTGVEGLYLTADVKLPTVAFERAGTSVAARVVVLDKVADPKRAPNQVGRDYTDASDIKAFFERIENATVPNRPEAAPEPAPAPAAPAASMTSAFAPTTAELASAFTTSDGKHSQTGAPIFYAHPTLRVERDEYDRRKAIATRHGGYWSSWKGGGAKPGFLFKSAEARGKFLAEVTSQVSEEAEPYQTRTIAVATLEAAPAPANPAEARRAAMERFAGQTYTNAFTGMPVRVSGRGIREAIALSRSPLDLRALDALPQLIENAVLTDTQPNRREREEAFGVHTLHAPLAMDGQLYRVRLTVRETNEGNRYYGQRIEGVVVERAGELVGAPLGGLSRLSPTLPTRLSLSELMASATPTAVREDGEGYETRPREIFYSQLLRAVEGSKQKKAGALQWLATLKNTQGVKQEELDWIGLGEWLGRQDGPVTREAVADFVRANQVTANEVLYGAPAEEAAVRRAVEQLLDAGYTVVDDYIWTLQDENGREVDTDDLSPELRAAWDLVRDAELDEDGVGRATTTKYAQYQLPGGENYRELLLTLPSDTPKEDLDTEYYRATTTDFRGGHWSEPNVLAHVRFNERVDADGKRVLFIEEIQSDWHQAGRKRGYATTRPLSDEDVRAFHDMSEFVWSEAGEAERADLRREAARLGATPGVPDAPFKTTWPELALKRMIRWATEQGFERIAWTTGDQQNERYQLAKSIGALVYIKSGTSGFSPESDVEGQQTGTLKALDKNNLNRSVLERSNVGPAELESIVGKELAERLLAAPYERRNPMGVVQHIRELRGVDLEMGGAGMRGFYDKILVDTANKLTRKWGGKVGNTALVGAVLDVRVSPDGPSNWAVFVAGEGVGDFKTEEEANLHAASILKRNRVVVHSLDVTPAMRQASIDGFAIFEPRRAYRTRRAPSPQMGFDFDALPTRPETTPAQATLGRTAMAELVSQRDLAAGVSVLADRIPKAFEAAGGVNLIGQTINNLQDLAVLGQVFRDPRFETLRFFAVKNGQIVYHSGITNRAPGFVSFPKDTQNKLFDTLKGLDADGWYMFHNHPSGDPTPSSADIRATIGGVALSKMNGLPPLLGHVIVDTNRYTEINDRGLPRTFPLPVSQAWTIGQDPRADHQLLAQKIFGGKDLVTIANALAMAPNDQVVTIVGTSSRNDVTAIADFPVALLFKETGGDGVDKVMREPYLRGVARLRKFARESGSARLFAIHPDRQLMMPLIKNGVLTDTTRPGDWFSASEERATPISTDTFGETRKRTMTPVWVSEADTAIANQAATELNETKQGELLASMSLASTVGIESGARQAEPPILARGELTNADQVALDDAIVASSYPPEISMVASPMSPYRAAPVPQNIKDLRKKIFASDARAALPWKDRVRLVLDRFRVRAALAFRQYWIDKFNAFAAYEKLINGGELLDASQSGYKQAIATQNLQGVMHSILYEGIPEWRGGAYVPARDGRKGILGIFAPIVNAPEGNLLPLWEVYAVARRSSRLITETNADGTSREKLLNEQDIADGLALETQYPQFRQVFDDWQAFNKQTLDMAEAAGIIDPAARAIWESNDYLPFYRAVESVSGKVNPVSLDKAIANQRSKIRRLTGGTEQLEDVFENLMMNTAHLVDASFKNRAAQTLVEQFDGVATKRVNWDFKAIEVGVDEINRALRAAGLAVQPMVHGASMDEWATFFRPLKPVAPNVITVMFDGKPKFYEVDDPLLLQSFVEMNPNATIRQLDLQTGGVLSGAKSLLTRSVTILPGFQIANWLRDSQAAWVQNKQRMTPYVDAIKGFRQYMNDEPLVRDLMMMGAFSDGLYDTRRGALKKMLMRKMREQDATNLLNSVISPKTWWGKYLEIQQAAENANRVAAFNAARKAGLSAAEAAYQAHDVLNFQSHGAGLWAQLLTMNVPFLNARLQGLDRLQRGFKENRTGFFLKGSALTLMTLLLAWMQEDDERYEELPEWERDVYWHFFIGDKHFRLPKPFEVGAMFATIPERAFRLMRGTDTGKITMQSMGRMVFDTFAFNPIPQAVKPLVEQVTNYSFFRRQPIIGQWERDGLPETQYRAWTSPSLISLAENMPDWAPDAMRSPLRLENWLRGYFGGLAELGWQTSDRIVRSAGGFADAPAKPLYEEAFARFYREGPATSTKWVDELYRMAAEADSAQAAISQYQRQGRYEQAKELMERRRGQIIARPRLNELAKQLREINAQSRQVRYSKVPPKQKQEMIERLTQKRNEIARKVAPYADAF